MNWTKVRAIVDKEIADARKNKMITISMALLPIVLVALTLGTSFFMLRSNSGLSANDAGMIPPELRNYDPVHAFLIMMNDQYMFYFLLIPMMMPVFIAAYSIVGEKETRSLEPLLATPITVGELLLGKSIAAVAPAVILTWLSYVMLVIGGYFIMPEPVFQALVRPVWIVGMLLLSPLLALLSVLSGMIVSSRLNDPRAAQQVTGIFIVPIIGLSLLVLAGKILVSIPLIALASAAILVLDILMLFFAIKLFQRETILTRWK